MVWFQCEDCGDNLKKPKLANHFRICSAFKLSCIDCGQVFGKHDVESHTQCITEMEKYGPKGQVKAANGSNGKPTKPKPEVDINVGLSDRPPWFCSLCNTKATSKQTLLLHADGKKHRGKARAFHASKLPPNDTRETNDSNANNVTNEAPESKNLGEPKDTKPSETAPPVVLENDASKSNKKRKHQGSENGDELGNGEVLKIKGEEKELTKSSKKAKESTTKEDALDSTHNMDQNIKWKKLITTALKSNPEGILKLKQLRKSVMKSLEESGIKEDKKQVTKILEEKINSSSRFIVDGKQVRLAASS